MNPDMSQVNLAVTLTVCFLTFVELMEKLRLKLCDIKKHVTLYARCSSAVLHAKVT